MKVRIKFSKQGEMRFIGHLDLMRFFQKAFRRSGIDIKFSEGMSPHMIMSFASPLGVGLTSQGEYVDIEIGEPVTTAQALERLNAQMCEGMRILDWREIEQGKASTAMSIVAAADYDVSFRKGYAPEQDWQSDISGFFARKEILVAQENKKAAKKAQKRGKHHREKQEELPEGSRKTAMTLPASEMTQGPGSESSEADQAATMKNIRPMIYEMRVDHGTVSMKLASGSAANLRPEVVMKAYFAWKGIEVNPLGFAINRKELYADQGKGEKHRFISLNDLGTVIE